ncbi:MAG TPA: N-acetylmuramoyl-L-alanine amidase [Pseudolabrys sp.]|nr:N-acetylmuramoyl-L-alanine amidase [Pseudolabrys sp.]
MSLFPPDSSLVAEVVPSPNHDERKDGLPPDMIVLHYTGMQDDNAAVERLCSTQARVSCHYVVFDDGRILQLVQEARRAWHAGVSSWEGAVDNNSRSIGIEICNPGHDFGYPEFPRRQIAAVIALCRGILTRRRQISPDHVLAHSDVAPARKQDPGEKFPWKLLYESGVGHWVPPAPIIEGPRLAPGDIGEHVRNLQKVLASYGYSVPETGIFDETTREVVVAFQRHFRPERVDGIADTSTIATLNALVSSKPARPA